MSKEELKDFEMEVERLYDEWLYKTENRGISYGEIVYIQSLCQSELEDMYEELTNELEKEEEE